MKWGVMVMKSKTSFINTGVLRNDIKRFIWISIAYLLGLLLTVPLKIFMLFSKAEEVNLNDVSIYLRMFQFDSNASMLQLMLIFIIPVLTGLVLFRYLNSKRASDLEHTLPIRRETLYNTHLSAGIIFLFAPLIITALVSWLLVGGLGIVQVKGVDILIWLGVSLLFNLLLFLTSVAIGMFCGMSSVQGALTYILLLLPSGFSFLLIHNMSIHIYGFALDYYSPNLESLSPLLRLAEAAYRPFRLSEIIIYLLTCAVLYLAGRFFYQRRHLERTGNAITSSLLRPILLFGVTFCSMLLGGSYFSEMQNSASWTYFGYILGSLLAYFLLEILLSKSLHVFNWKSLKGYASYALFIIVMLGLLQFDLTGYERSLPDLSEIESVYLDNGFRLVNQYNSDSSIVSAKYESAPQLFKDRSTIANVYALHQQIIANRAQEKPDLLSGNQNHERICLAYSLKNGQHLYRQYSIDSDNYAQQLKPIYESREYKNLHHAILRINPDLVKEIDLHVSNSNKNLEINNQEDIRQAIAALQSDILNQSYEEMQSDRPGWAYIDLYMDRDYGTNLSWDKSYTKFEQWLKDKNLYSQARILPDDIAFAVVEKNPDFNNAGNTTQAIPTRQITPRYLNDLAKKPGTLLIKNADQLELCLRSYTYAEQSPYQIFFLLQDGNIFSGEFAEDEVPAFIKAGLAGQKDA